MALTKLDLPLPDLPNMAMFTLMSSCKNSSESKSTSDSTVLVTRCSCTDSTLAILSAAIVDSTVYSICTESQTHGHGHTHTKHCPCMKSTCMKSNRYDQKRTPLTHTVIERVHK